MGKSFKDRRTRSEGNWRNKSTKKVNKKWQNTEVKPSRLNSKYEDEDNANSY
jgi:hypothetical protein